MIRFLRLGLWAICLVPSFAGGQDMESMLNATAKTRPECAQELRDITTHSTAARKELEQCASRWIPEPDGSYDCRPESRSMKYAAQLCEFQLKRMQTRFPQLCKIWTIYAIFRDEKLGDNIVWGDPQTMVFREWTVNGEKWHQQSTQDYYLPEDFPRFPARLVLKKIHGEAFLVGTASHRMNSYSTFKDRMELYFGLRENNGMRVVKMIRYESPVLGRHSSRLGPEVKVSETSYPAVSP